MEKDNSLKKQSLKPLLIGITGGIGSGKTTVCKIFEFLGIPVYYADDRAKKIMVENPYVIEKIIDEFGADSYFADGKLNRAFIANIVFNDAKKLNVLNNIVHPAVREDGQTWHQSLGNVPYAIKEAALMIESENYQLMDKLVLVTAPEQMRIKRVMLRDSTSKKEVISRMKKQMPELEKIAYANYIIRNDGTKSLIKQVFGIHQELKGLQNGYNE